VLALAVSACTAPPDDGSAQSDDQIVSIPQTEIERSSIGCTWLYSYAQWTATMHGKDLDPSPAYWAYWHWFDQIAAGFGTTIATGGNWATANSIAAKYGVMPSNAFLGDGADGGARLDAALATIRTSLESGVLSTTVARRDRLAVRRELDRAWALSPDVTGALDHVFGDHVDRNFLPTSDIADTSGTAILRAGDVTVSYASGPGAKPAQHSLSDAMREWREVYYKSSDRAEFFPRVQRAVADAQPVLMTWFVDFDALETRDNGRLGSFNVITLNELGPGSQGGHTAIVTGVGFDAAQQLQALRVGNAWGAAHPARAYLPGMPDRHDLWLDYLDGPVKRCVANGDTTDTTNCPYEQVPLQDVVLPPGY
jgi:hypothetical protein